MKKPRILESGATKTGIAKRNPMARVVRGQAQYKPRLIPSKKRAKLEDQLDHDNVTGQDGW